MTAQAILILGLIAAGAVILAPLAALLTFRTNRRPGRPLI
jgi:hypothetical protein